MHATYTVISSHEQSVDWLLDQPNQHGDCPLHLAVKKGHINVAEQLLEAGADVAVKV